MKTEILIVSGVTNTKVNFTNDHNRKTILNDILNQEWNIKKRTWYEGTWNSYKDGGLVCFVFLGHCDQHQGHNWLQ